MFDILIKKLYPNDPGFTYDMDNPIRNDMPKIKRRIDRILVKSKLWEPKEACLLGNQIFIESIPNLRPSDHYGVMSRLSCTNE